MKSDKILQQSENAYNQWCVQWREHAKFHSKHTMYSFDELRNIGIGRAVVSVANGYSFEQNIELLKKYKKNVDFMACDKTMGHLLDNGITPRYVLVCDANVSYEKYMEKYKSQLQDTILIMNVCANPQWSENGNWEKKFFFVNKDVLNSEKEFTQLSGCHNQITAGTNVSNMMLVALTQCDNHTRQNFFGYDKIVLVGFDYCWTLDGKYYAFDDDGGGKKFYMRHIYGLSPRGNFIFTSNNLSSSASWMNTYVEAFKIPVVQCSPDSLVNFSRSGDLKEQLRYRYKTSDKDKVTQMANKKAHLEMELKKIHDSLREISKSHFYSHLATV